MFVTQHALFAEHIVELVYIDVKSVFHIKIIYGIVLNLKRF